MRRNGAHWPVDMHNILICTDVRMISISLQYVHNGRYLKSFVDNTW
jgi:hypothetical protein